MSSSPTRRLLGAALVTVAGSSLLPRCLEAQVIYSGPVSIPLPPDIVGIYLNISTGAANPDRNAVPGWDLNPFNPFLEWGSGGGSSGLIANLAGGASSSRIDNLPMGLMISGSLGYNFAAFGSTETNGSTAPNLNSSNNYFGFRFTDESAGGAIRYGWLQVQLGTSLSDPTRRIIGFAYEASGQGIAAGDTVGVAVPEPGTYLAGLAAGAVALRAWRRRRAMVA